MKEKAENNPQTANSDLGAVSSCCKCVDCGKDFEPYAFSEECSCDDGAVEMEMEWDYEPQIYTCHQCKGRGFVDYTEKRRCKPCKEHFLYDEWEEDDDKYYCEHCGRACNCH